MNLHSDVLENFERAFSSGTIGCRRTCKCGREFYDTANSYDWESGEMEALIASEATPLGYSVGTLYLEGNEYCVDCQCWYPLAERVINWINDNSESIANFLRMEKARKTREAEHYTTV